jgi:hypothetical protein
MPSINDHEYSIHSQNGEDGIIAFLSGGLRECRQRFLEIGTSDGAQNNTLYLLRRGWSGCGVDADAEAIRRYQARAAALGLSQRLRLLACRVSWRNAKEVLACAGDAAPDVFSLDIDGNDYYVALRLLELGLRPAIICCEFNPFLGAAPLTVRYREDFSRYREDPQRGLYFGVSAAAWQHLFASRDYRFCGVDRAGVNAFFCREDAFREGFLAGVSGLAHAYSRVFVEKYAMAGEALEQELLGRTELGFVDVSSEDVRVLAENAAPTPEPASERPTTPVVHAAATFHAEGYERFGKRFIESFRRHWPKETKLWIFAEGCAPEGCDRVIVRDLHTDARDLAEFKRRHAGNPGAHGRFGQRYEYMLDAVRWSHRIFALREACERSDADILINIDADIVCFEDMPLEFLAGLMPAQADIGYMPRRQMYSECSFVLYRIRRPAVVDFIWKHTDYYTSDAIFTLPRWTDCHAFDAMVAQHRRRGDLAFHNINEGVPDSMHPFVNGPLGRYMDHLKGEERKAAGRSSGKDLVVQRDEAYWAAS